MHSLYCFFIVKYTHRLTQVRTLAHIHSWMYGRANDGVHTCMCVCVFLFLLRITARTVCCSSLCLCVCVLPVNVYVYVYLLLFFIIIFQLFQYIIARTPSRVPKIMKMYTQYTHANQLAVECQMKNETIRIHLNSRTCSSMLTDGVYGCTLYICKCVRMRNIALRIDKMVLTIAEPLMLSFCFPSHTHVLAIIRIAKG